MSPQNSANSNDSATACGGIQIKDDHFVSECRNSSESSNSNINSNQNDHITNVGPNETGMSIKRSTSNQHQQQSAGINKSPGRGSLKTQPIPMNKQSQEPIKAHGQQNTGDNNEDENSTDEYNSSSIASTPDTMYYFKLKSAAFVPSASFTNNYYSSSFGNISQEQDNLPFISLMQQNENMNTSTATKQKVIFY